MKDHLKFISLLAIIASIVVIVITAYLAFITPISTTTFDTIINPYLAIIASACAMLTGLLIFSKRNHVFSSENI